MSGMSDRPAPDDRAVPDPVAAGAEIQRRLGVKTSRDEPLGRFTTMRVGGPADLFAVVRNAFELRALVKHARARAIPFVLLGRGSNVVISDRGIRGLVIQARAEGWRIEGQRLIAEAGLHAVPNPLINITLQGRHDTYPKRRGITRIKELLERRSATQPTQQPSCGSVFRNPPHDFAARLIESCGLKGERIGNAQVSEKHANFIVNLGGAKAADIEALMRYVQSQVKQKHGVWLEPEVRIIGEFE